MTKPTVLVFETIHERGMALLEEHANVRLVSGWDEDTVCREAVDVSGIVVRANGRVTARVMDSAPQLKVIGRHGIGVDNIDLEAAAERGLIVVNTPTAPVQAVAEYVIGVMVMLSKSILPAHQATVKGNWQFRYSEAVHSHEIRGRTLGLIGAGRIGTRVAEMAVGAFDVKLIYHDAYPNPSLEERFGAERCDMDTLLNQADFVTLHVPSTPETHHLIGAQELAKMKPKAFLINSARGAVVDSKALYDALSTNQIAGAAIDVFEQEPVPKDEPLLSLPNVVLMPHMAGHSEEALIAMSMVAKDIVGVLKGDKPLHPVVGG